MTTEEEYKTTHIAIDTQEVITNSKNEQVSEKELLVQTVNMLKQIEK